jgi:hypothetical protein
MIEVMREQSIDLYRTQLLRDISAVTVNPENIKIASNTFDHYRDSLLPHLAVPGKVNKKLTPQDYKEIAKLLNELNGKNKENARSV